MPNECTYKTFLCIVNLKALYTHKPVACALEPTQTYLLNELAKSPAIHLLAVDRLEMTVNHDFLKTFWQWHDIRPSMVTHTRNSCSAFKPSKVHTHHEHTQQWTHTHHEHTPGAVGSHLYWGARGAVGGSVPCSRVSTQSWYWRWRERWTFTPPTYNSCRPETQTTTFGLRVRLSNH